MVIDFEYYVDLIKQTLNAGDNENGKKILRFLLSRTRWGNSGIYARRGSDPVFSENVS